MRRLLLVLAGCGHTVKVGAGPLVDSRGKPGIETSIEIGTHLIGSKEVAMPIGVRVEASSTTEGPQAMLALTYGATLPPGGRRTTPTEATTVRRGWGGRLGLASGVVIDRDGAAFTARGGAAATRGSLRPGARTSGGCSGHEKSSLCYSWRRWNYEHVGVELATAFRFRNDRNDGDRKLRLDGWRVAAELVYERGALSDLQLH